MDNAFSLLESAPNAMLVADPAGRIIFINRLAEALFGYGNGELEGQDVACLLPQRYREEYSAYLQQHMMGGTGLKLFARRKDDSEIAVEIDISALEAASGTLAMAAIRSISWQDISQDTSQQSETSLEHIIESINDVVWSISPDGNHVLFVNSAWEKVFGHSHVEAQNNPGLWQQTIHPEDRALTAAALTNVLAKGQLDMEYRIVRPDGEIRWISDHSTLVLDAQGVPARIDGIGRDVTRQKQAEQHQADLVQELKSANEELKNFAYVVSHDLKAPLRAIGSLVEWIAADYAEKFDDEGREHLRLLVGRARRMDALIDGILQYSRVGRTHEELAKVNLDALLHEVMDSLAPPAHFNIQIDNPLPTLNVERTRIQQVFQNLLSNAIKYCDKAQPTIHIGCMAEQKAWKFYVSDNGPGIEQRHFDRIFQLFQTLMPRDRVESTGVGLALVKKIVELHDGSVWLESRIGEGTTFFFTLPKGKNGRKE